MPMTTTTPRCAGHLELVDAAFDRPGGAAADELRVLCERCPVAQTCFHQAMNQYEAGVWGGTTSNQRVRAGGAARPGSEVALRRRQEVS